MEREILETVAITDTFVTDLAKIEPVSNGVNRIYLCARQGRDLILQSKLIIPDDSLADIGGMIAALAPERHDGPGREPARSAPESRVRQTVDLLKLAMQNRRLLVVLLVCMLIIGLVDLTIDVLSAQSVHEAILAIWRG